MMSSPDDGDNSCTSSDRRLQDEQLYAHLRATSFQGDDYDDYIATMIDYATGVLWKMIRDDELWGALEKIRRPRTRPLDWSESDREQLVADSVTDGFLDFHNKVLVADRWDPSSASLRTLLVRYCLGRFADHYQKWQRRSLTRLSQQAQRDPDFRGPQQTPSAEHIALAKQSVAELSQEQFAHGAGYSHKEIGQMLNISGRAVEAGYTARTGVDSPNTEQVKEVRCE
jgi:hypothetical protein